ncbi:hypothetical protein HYC85_017278 [Camellia sinensis]|uniref:GDSL esterase/lipase n=1 Tax=Camellia sinensis TaxID=4442 RepID=A0A7J7H261_CAMSI|nr:hypothetical protein HYC85_017278 [Camellia sinensis]
MEVECSHHLFRCLMPHMEKPTEGCLHDKADPAILHNFKYVESACCGAGRLNAEILCNATANLCMNRKEYLFWDLYHVTQTASQLAAVMLYDGPPRFVTPITFRQLAEDN